MELIFLGTGGGRINLIKQIRGTGGFRINSQSANIHVDPGPGALLRTINLGLNPLDLDAIIVTHNHIDHFSDAMVLTEAMCHYTLKKQGILIASKECINGDRYGDRAIHLYHQKRIALIYAAEYYDKKRFKTKKGSFEIEIYPLKHEELTNFGFKLKIDGAALGYISDTEYLDSLRSDFSGCDCLILNCLKPKFDKFVGHLTSRDAIEILEKAKPKMAVLSHLGMSMLRAGPKKEAAYIEKESGVKTIAAQDGMRLFRSKFGGLFVNQPNVTPYAIGRV